jgi:hypothetical protein
LAFAGWTVVERIEKKEIVMGAKFYRQSPRGSSPKLVWDDHVREALEKQKASRPPKGKPNIMPVSPTLPRVPKPYKRRKTQ